MTYQSPPPVQADPYRRGAIMLGILSLMSLGGSDVIGSLLTGGRVPIQWLALASVPILLGTAWGTTRFCLFS